MHAALHSRELAIQIDRGLALVVEPAEAIGALVVVAALSIVVVGGDLEVVTGAELLRITPIATLLCDLFAGLAVQSVEEGHAVIVAVVIASWCPLRRVSVLILPSMIIGINKVIVCEA